mgnify:CR=1 FL=1
MLWRDTPELVAEAEHAGDLEQQEEGEDAIDQRLAPGRSTRERFAQKSMLKDNGSGRREWRRGLRRLMPSTPFRCIIVSGLIHHSDGDSFLPNRKQSKYPFPALLRVVT